MPLTDVTNDFRKYVRDKEVLLPETKRRKINPKLSSEARAGANHHDKEYIAEAYTILNHISTLTRMLSNVRKAYLSVDSRTSPLSRQGSRNLTEGEIEWATVRHLTNEERDQIDLQAQVILQRCSSRIKEMEALEKRRADLVASKVNPLARLLPARLRQDESTLTSDVLAAHHSSITCYISRRLTEASQMQKDMQEERVKRQLERTRTLASGVAREASMFDARNSRVPESTTSSSWLGTASSSIIAATIGASAHDSRRHLQAPHANSNSDSSYMSEDDDDEIELTSSQILQFEAENATILRNVQDTLESVQQAESRLMDISALQMELVNHLTSQTELTDKLYEEAIATTYTVEKGNEQLKEAKQRAKDGRIFILVFLIGASASLLFLHYY